MAVQEQTPYIEYVANGSTTSFPIEFDCDDKNHLIVIVNDLDTQLDEWAFENKAVKFKYPPFQSSVVKIWRNTPLERTTTYQTYNNSLRPEVLNTDFDKVWIALQEFGVKHQVAENKLKEFMDSIVEGEVNGLPSEILARIDGDEKVKNFTLNAVKPKADKLYVDQLVINANKGMNNFKTQVELLAFRPTTTNYTGYALDTKKTFLWDGSKWNDTGLSEYDLAKNYIDSQDQILINKGKKYPFQYKVRSASNTSDAINSFMLNNILNIEIVGAEPGKVYQFVGYRSLAEAGGYPAHGWSFADCNESDWVSESPVRRTVCSYENNIKPIYANTGIQTVTLTSHIVKGLQVKITVDTENLPPNYVFVQVTGTSGSNYIIHPNCVTIDNITKIAESISEAKTAEQINILTTLSLNKAKEYPFISAVRNPENILGSHNFQKNNVLNIEVIGAEQGKLYAFRGYRSESDAGGLPPHGWSFADMEASNITDTPRTVVNYSNAIYPVTRNTGIQTVFVKSDVVEGLTFKVTLDTTSLSASYINLAAATGYGYNFIISPDLYLPINFRKSSEIIPENPSNKRALQDLTESLSNPYKSVIVTLIGDSNCWASGASNGAASSPRNHRLNDVRNNYTCNSFANLLRKWMCYAAGSNIDVIELNQAWIDSSTLNPNGSQYSGFAGNLIKSNIPLQDFISQLSTTLTADSSSSSGYVLPLQSTQSLELSIVGDNIKITIASQSVDSGGTVSLDFGGKVTNVSSYSATRQSIDVIASSTEIGNVKIKLTSTTNIQIEAIQHVRKVGLYNNGLIGTGVGNWSPAGSNLITAGVPAYTTHLLMWFGSNESDTYSITKSVELYKAMISWLRVNRPDLKLITIKPSRTDTTSSADEIYLRAMRANAYVNESIEQGIDVIDIWGATSVPIIYSENIWVDGVHLTDTGHKYVFEELVKAINHN